MSIHPLRSAAHAAVVSLLAVVVSPSIAQAGDPVQALQESQIRPGALPAWETAAERAASIPRSAPHPWNLPIVPGPPPTGYTVPAEFEKMSAFMVTEGDWDNSEVGMMLAMLKGGTVAQGAGAIVLTSQSEANYEAYLSGEGLDMSRIHVVRPPDGLNAKWARDFGPISLYEAGKPGNLAFGDLHYYDTRAKDDAVTAFLAGQAGINRYGLEGADHNPPDDVKLYMEGGNFQTDGKGTCILSNDIPSDNAKKGNTQADTIAKVEPILATYLGCKKVIWLTPVPHNSTGHVDMYSKLLTPTDMLVIETPHVTNQDLEVDALIQQNLDTLQASTNGNGDPFVVHRVVIPSLGNGWVYKTYTNSVIVNKVVLVPTYGNSRDQAALDVYKSVLGSSYTVTGIDSSQIVAQGGAVHCTTMQIASACGDGKLQKVLFEECDGQNLDGKTCASIGMTSGDLKCDPDTCRLDTSGCAGGQDAGPDAQPEASTDGAVDATPDATPDALPVESGGQDAGADQAIGQDAAAEAGEPVVPQPEASDDGSCGCRMRPEKDRSGWWLLAAGVGAALLARRRRS
ncbi:MAG: agmatine deiminase family protein [Deltaproteobacteria bacterium]|nr:agmatine deiminase family protein [Deltaproteobacteria bacterium]